MCGVNSIVGCKHFSVGMRLATRETRVVEASCSSLVPISEPITVDEIVRCRDCSPGPDAIGEFGPMRALVRIRFRTIPCRRAFPDNVFCDSDVAAIEGASVKEAADVDEGRGDSVSRSF